MKRAVLILLVCLVVAMTGVRAGETWTVCADGCEFTRIQQAVDFAEDGDVIRVEDPVHTEAGIIVDRIVTIEGLGRKATVVQGAETPTGSSETVFAVRRNGATVRDMTIRNAETGVYISGGQNASSWVFERLSFADLDRGLEVSLRFFVAEITVRDSQFRDLRGAAARWREWPRPGRPPGWLTLERCTVTNSGAIDGPQRATFAESTFHVNRGGIEADTLYLSNSTVSGNRMPFVPLRANVLWMLHSTITDNVTGSNGVFGARAVVMDHSILAGNRARRGGCEDESCEEALDCPLSWGGELFSRGYNLFGSDGACVSADPNDAFVDSEAVFTTLLGPLQNNGGPTPTHLPLAGGAAIDAGATACIDVDQRGLPRPIDGDGDEEARCDVGAVESLPANVLPNAGGIPGDTGTVGSQND